MSFAKDKRIIDYMTRPENENFFVEVLDECKHLNFRNLTVRQAYCDYSDWHGIKSLIMIEKGQCYFANIRSEHYEWMRRIIEPELPGMFYILFKQDIYDRFASDVGFNFRDVYHYHTMRLDKSDFHPLLLSQDEQRHIIHPNYTDTLVCRRLSPEDFPQIMSLQNEYLVEEVYGGWDKYPRAVEMKNLKRSLRNRIHYGVFVNGLPVSKANVNAESPNIYQIGGVFTNIRARGRHLAAHCLSHLLAECLTYKPSVSLYVRKENKSAVDLYKRLGFRILYDTVMCYVN